MVTDDNIIAWFRVEIDNNFHDFVHYFQLLLRFS